MRRLILTVVMILFVALVGLAYGEEGAKEGKAQVNAEWVAKVIRPVEAKLVSCIDFTFDPEKEGKVGKKIELRFRVDEKGNYDSENLLNSISYPGSMKVNGCFGGTLQSLKFPATGKMTNHVYQFEITPELEKAADALWVVAKPVQ